MRDTSPGIFIPEDSPFIAADPRRKRWAIPYHFDCLNARIENLLWNQRDAIAGKRILDLASHMGTFAFAALNLGAGFVQGVEGEKKLVGQAEDLFRQQGADANRYRFHTADVFSFLEALPEDAFDTVLCFGLLYYTTEPYRLLKLIRRAARETVLLDTFTARYAAVQGKDALEIFPRVNDQVLDLPLMLVTLTQPEKPGYRLPGAFPHHGKDLAMTAFPTHTLLELWMRSLMMDWHRIGWSPYIQRPCHWRDLFRPEQKQASHWADVYAAGMRVSYRMATAPTGRGK